MIGNKYARRKILLFLMLPLLASWSVTAFASTGCRSRHITRMEHSHFRAPLTQLRAGSAVPVASITAKATSAFLAINGVILLANPAALLEDSNELDTWLVRAIGALGLGVAIQVSASILANNIIAPRTAMGLGLIPRSLFFLVTIASGQMQKLKIQSRFFTINTILTMWCCVSLLFGLGNPPQTAKVFSAMCLLKSTFFVTVPSKVSGKLLDEPCRGKSLALVRALGNELMTSAFLMFTAAWGANDFWTPSTAAGSTCVLWILLLADMAWVDKTWRLMESNSPRAQLLHMVFAGLFAAGFLFAK